MAVSSPSIRGILSRWQRVAGSPNSARMFFWPGAACADVASKNYSAQHQSVHQFQLRTFARQSSLARRRKTGAAAGSKALAKTSERFEMNTYGEPERYDPIMLQDSISSLPSTIPTAPSGFQWWWIPTIRSAVLVPAGWHSWSGRGNLLVCEMEKHLITPSPAPVSTGVSMWVSQIKQPLGGRLFVHDAPFDVAEWMVANLTRRAAEWRDNAARAAGVNVSTSHAANASTEHMQARAQAVLNAASNIAGDDAPLKQQIAAALASNSALAPLGGNLPDLLPENLQAAAEGHVQVTKDARSGKEDWQQTIVNSTAATEATPPDIIDTWHFRPFDGLDSFGIEFVMASAHAGPDPDASGRRFHMHIAVDSDANTVTEIVFSAPEMHWSEAWRQHGQVMVENMYLNWEDSSPYKMA